MYKPYTLREMKNILAENAYSLERVKGGHLIYKNENGNTIVINKNLRIQIANMLIRRNNLKVANM